MKPKQPRFKYVAHVVIETEQKVTKRAIKNAIEYDLGETWFNNGPAVALIQAWTVRVRSVDFD